MTNKKRKNFNVKISIAKGGANSLSLSSKLGEAINQAVNSILSVNKEYEFSMTIKEMHKQV